MVEIQETRVFHTDLVVYECRIGLLDWYYRWLAICWPMVAMAFLLCLPSLFLSSHLIGILVLRASMSTANRSSSCNAAIELRTPLTPPLPPGQDFSSYGDENIGACMDWTRLPKAPVLALERSATGLSMVDDASSSTDESPSCALDSPRSLPSVAERQKTPPSMGTACPLPAPAALESSAGVSSIKRKKPRDPGLSINTDIDDHEVDVRFIKAIRSRRLK